MVYKNNAYTPQILNNVRILFNYNYDHAKTSVTSLLNIYLSNVKDTITMYHRKKNHVFREFS